MTDDVIYGWHFLDIRGLSHGGYVPAPVGEWEPEIAEPILCKRGYHGCVRLLDALRYAPGPVLQRCEYRGVVYGDDKFVASSRRALARVDAAPLLRRFALVCAERVAQHATDPRVAGCLQTVRLYLDGASSLANLVAARQDAADAAYAAASASAASASAVAAYAAAYAAAAAAYATDAAADAAAYAADAAAAAYERAWQRDWLESAALDLDWLPRWEAKP